MASDLDLTAALEAARTAACSHVWDLMLTSPCLECRLAAAAPLIEAAARAKFVAEIEAPGSFLCDCDSHDCPPTNRGQPIDHHCECPAVYTAAALLDGRYSATRHAAQCGHGTEHDRLAEASDVA